MNDDLTILKLFFLLEKTYQYDSLFADVSTRSYRKLKNTNNDISVFGNDPDRYFIMFGMNSVITITCNKANRKVVNVGYHKHEQFEKVSVIYEEIYAAAVEHNFLHEVGKFS